MEINEKQQQKYAYKYVYIKDCLKYFNADWCFKMRCPNISVILEVMARSSVSGIAWRDRSVWGSLHPREISGCLFGTTYKPSSFKKLCASVPTRTDAVLKATSGPSKYWLDLDPSYRCSASKRLTLEWFQSTYSIFSPPYLPKHLHSTVRNSSKSLDPPLESTVTSSVLTRRDHTHAVCHMFCLFFICFMKRDWILINHSVLISQTKTLSDQAERNTAHNKINISAMFWRIWPVNQTHQNVGCVQTGQLTKRLQQRHCD